MVVDESVVEETGSDRPDTGAFAIRTLGGRWLELWAYGSFAVAQPLLSLLGANATFFTAHRMHGAGLVRYALLLLIVPPTALVLVEWALSLVSRRGARLLHDLLIGLCIAATVAPPVARALGAPPNMWLASIVAIAIGATAAMRRLSVRATLAKVLAFAPVLFIAHFALLSPAAVLVSGRSADSTFVETDELAPIVWVVFDQFPLPLIVDGEGAIVAERYPSLARLAASSTWYPHATAGTVRTDLSVPAALTGTWPKWDQLPVASQHPANLFTILGRDSVTGASPYTVHADEYVTQLCPDVMCGPSERNDSTWPDTIAVYTRYLLPGRVADRLVPRIDDRWDDFGAEQDTTVLVADEAGSADEVLERRLASDDNATRFGRFLDRLREPGLTGVHYIHLFLPHEPLHYLPDGRIAPAIDTVRTDEEGRWPDDEAAMRSRLQQYVAQAMYADALVGTMLDALEASGTFDETLVVVMSDHGASTRPGTINRSATDPDSSVDSVPFPLFIKAPGQRTAAVDPSIVQQVDILPTVLELLGVDSDVFGFDGVPLIDDTLGERADRTPHLLTEAGLGAFVNPPVATDSPTIGWGAETFADPSDPYRLQPYGELIGTVPSMATGEELTAERLSLDDPGAFADVDTSGPTVPANVSGRISGVAGGQHVAVLVNGTIAGVGQTWYTIDGRFSVLVDPQYFEAGANEITVRLLSSEP